MMYAGKVRFAAGKTTGRATLRFDRDILVRPGFTLLEIVATLTILGLLFTVIAGLLWSTVRIERAEVAAFQRSIAIGTLADQFRADVHSAGGVVRELDRFTAGRDCLILVKGRGEAVIYRWTAGRLERICKHAGEVTYQAVPIPDETVVDFPTNPESELVEIALRPEKPSPSRRPVHIRAALGGNR